MLINGKEKVLACPTTLSELLTQLGYRAVFVAVELNLYLDTHPGDAAARSDYLYYSTRLKELIAAYEEQYGPLMNFGHSATATGCYVCSEWPWD